MTSSVVFASLLIISSIFFSAQCDLFSIERENPAEDLGIAQHSKERVCTLFAQKTS